MSTMFITRPLVGRMNYPYPGNSRLRHIQPRNCPTDEESQSDIGATEQPPSIVVKKSKKRVQNQAECTALIAARKVCVYLRSPDPSKFPVSPFNGQYYVDRYYDKANWTSLPRPWSKCLPKDPWAYVGDPYFPYNSFLYVQARKRDVSQCQCSHYLPSKIDNNSGYFCIDFLCGCPHSRGSFGPIPHDHNANPAQLAALGRSLAPGLKIDLNKIRQSGGLYCPESDRFYLCPSRSLRRFSLIGPRRSKRKRSGSKLSLTDCKHARQKKLDYLAHKNHIANIQDNNATTDSDQQHGSEGV